MSRATDDRCDPERRADCATALLRHAARRADVGRRASRSAAGSRTAASTASTSPSSTCATTPASSSASSTAPTTLRTRVRRARHRHRAAAPRGHGRTPELATGEVELGDCDGRGPRRGRAAAVLARRPHRGRRGGAPALPLSRPALGADAGATCACAPRSTRRIRARDGAPGLRRDRDAAAVDADARGRARVRDPLAAAATARSTCCRRAPRSPSSSRWSAASTATTRSPAACATRTCAPTASSSSPSSTSRPPSSTEDDVRGVRLRGGARRRRGGDRRAARRRSTQMTWDEAHRPLRHRQARPALRDGARRPRRRVRGDRVQGLRAAGGEGDRARRRRRARRGRASTRSSIGPSPSARRASSGCASSPARTALDLESPVAKFLRRRGARGLVGATGAGAGRPRPRRRRRAPSRLRGARPAAGRPRRARRSARGRTGSVWVIDFPLFDGVDDDGTPVAAHHPFTMPKAEDLDRARDRPAAGPRPVLRPRAERLGARLGEHPDPPRRHPAAGLRRARDLRRGGRGAFRLPARRLPLRRAAARRLRRRARPARRDPRRRGEHPRGHRLPEDPVRRRPR